MKVAAVTALVVGVLALLSVPSESQPDLSKVLVGKWEGNAPRASGGDPRRTLVFESVRQEGGRWIAEAKFGIPGRPLVPVDVTLDVTGAIVRVQFSPGIGFNWDLTLLSDKLLAGSIRRQTSLGHVEGSITLEKTQ